MIRGVGVALLLLAPLWGHAEPTESFEFTFIGRGPLPAGVRREVLGHGAYLELRSRFPALTSEPFVNDHSAPGPHPDCRFHAWVERTSDGEVILRAAIHWRRRLGRWRVLADVSVVAQPGEAGGVAISDKDGGEVSLSWTSLLVR